MNTVRLLLKKELTLLRNTYFRTRRQAAATVGLSLLGLSVTMALTWGSLLWFRPLVEGIPPEVAGSIFQSLVLVVYTWVTFIFMFSTMQESRNRFFLTPDLALLVAAPVNPAIFFALRFMMFTCFNPSNLFQLSLFGFAPLIALGVLASAPWYYYALLVPVTYLYLLIPAVVGVALIMLLMRVLSPKRLFQAAAAFNGVMGALWFVFVLGDNQEAILTGLVGVLGKVGPVIGVLFPLRAVGAFWTAVLGHGGSSGLPLVILAGSSAVVFCASMLVISRVYYYNYERMQTAEARRQRTSPGHRRGFRLYPGRSPLSLMVWMQWKMAVRNREMAQGALGIITLLVAYVLILGRLVSEGSPLIMLINIAVTSFFVNVLVQAFFLPFAMIGDRSVLRTQYWVYKATPLKARDASWALYLANAVPALPMGLVVLFLANYFTGITGPLMHLSLGLMSFVLVSSAALFQLTTLMEAGALGEAVPLLTRAFRETAPVLYNVLVLLPLVVGFYFLRFSFLSFMHALPQAGVLALAVLLSMLFMILVFRESVRGMKAIWSSMEIK